jgi:hypothetical protein
MKSLTPVLNAMGLALTTLAAGCGSSGTGSNGLSLEAVHPWDGGADAGCVISSTGIRVTCATAYRIQGDPYACPGFDPSGAGTTSACSAACMSGSIAAATCTGGPRFAWSSPRIWTRPRRSRSCG